MSNASSHPNVPRGQSQFPYAQFFPAIDLLADLQLPKSKQPWIGRVPHEVEEREYVSYLGCNVLQTPPLIPTTTDVLTRMGVDVTAVGGPANCCSNFAKTTQSGLLLKNNSKRSLAS